MCVCVCVRTQCIKENKFYLTKLFFSLVYTRTACSKILSNACVRLRDMNGVLYFEYV